MAYERFAPFAAWLEQLGVGRKLPAFALAVLHDDDVALWVRGEVAFGSGCPVHADTLFRVGSLTKLFTAALILRLAERGALDLDTPITAYAPHLSFAQPQLAEQLTLRLLLSHTGGLPTGLSYSPYRLPDALERYLQRTLPQLDPVAPIGTHYYSNHGINLAAYIAQYVTQTPYERLVHDWVFAPAAMPTATFDPHRAMTYPLALSHDRAADGRLVVRRPFHDNPAMRPCGFALASLNDLIAFARWWLRNAALLEQMAAPHADLLTADYAAYGLGARLYRYRGLQVVGHYGAIDKYGAQLWCIPQQRLAVIMLCNYAPPHWATMQALRHAIFEAYLPPAASAEVALESSLSPPLTGAYLGDEVGLVVVQSDENGAWVDWHQTIYRLQPARERVFVGHNAAAAPISVGFEAGGWLRLNGAPCRPLPTVPPAAPFPAARCGVYRGDLDTLIVRQERGALTVYSHDEDARVAASALDARTLACPYGLLEWLDENTVRWAKAYTLRRVTSDS